MVKAKKRKKSLNIEATIWASIFLIPIFARVFITQIFTSFESILFSFFDYDYGNPPGTFVGFENYKALLTSDLFWLQVKNTIVLYCMSMIGFGIPLIQALCLDQIKRGHGILKWLYVVPCGLPAVAGASVWMYLWEPDVGLANQLIGLFGVEPQSWLYDAKLIKWCIVIPGFMGGGMGVLTYLVVIRGVDPSLYEAAKLDGASDFQLVRYITIPNIMYYVSLSLVLSLTSILSAFDGPYLYTNGTGGPEHAAETAIMGIYNRAFDQMQYGSGMAASVLIVLFSLVFVVISQVAKRLMSKGDD